MKNQEIIDKIGELPKTLSEDWIEKAIQKLDKSKMTSEQRMHFEMLLAKNATIIEKEMEERRRAIKEAEDKVRKETTVETAKKMLSKGMNFEEIAEITGLSIKNIKTIS